MCSNFPVVSHDLSFPWTPFSKPLTCFIWLRVFAFPRASRNIASKIMLIKLVVLPLGLQLKSCFLLSFQLWDVSNPFQFMGCRWLMFVCQKSKHLYLKGFLWQKQNNLLMHSTMHRFSARMLGMTVRVQANGKAFMLWRRVGSALSVEAEDETAPNMWEGWRL